MNEGIYDTAALQVEVARLYEELAKANGACADMACELRGLVDQLELLESERDKLQVRCERLGAQLDEYQRTNKRGWDL